MRPLPTADLDNALDAHGVPWDGLRGARLFVTGGTGFFGCWLLETLLAADRRRGLGVSAVVLSRDPAAFSRGAPHLAADPRIEVLRGDARDVAAPGRRFTHVVHAATGTGPDPASQPPAQLAAGIVAAARSAARVARECGARRLLFTSSGAVYGRQPAGVTHAVEDPPPAPGRADRTAYGEAKLAAERLLCADGGFETAIARCFAFVGPRLPLDGAFAAGNFVRDALAGGPIRVNGDGTPLRSYLYAADLAAWLWTILLRGAPSRPYNVGSDEAVSILELARAVARAAAPGVRVVVARTPDRAAPPERYVPSIRRAADELGLRAAVGLDEAIARTCRWYDEERKEAVDERGA